MTAKLKRLFTQFSFPGGIPIPSHVAAETPGSINDGGELAFSLAHAYGAAFDNPGLVVACVVGDAEAETGALSASWHSNKHPNPARDGAPTDFNTAAWLMFRANKRMPGKACVFVDYRTKEFKDNLSWMR